MQTLIRLVAVNFSPILCLVCIADSTARWELHSLMMPLNKHCNNLFCFPGDFSLTDGVGSHHWDECDSQFWEPGVLRVLLPADVWPDLLSASGGSHLPGDPLEVHRWQHHCPGPVRAVPHRVWYSVVLIVTGVGDGTLSGQHCAKLSECDGGYCTGGRCWWSAQEWNTSECLYREFVLDFRYLLKNGVAFWRKPCNHRIILPSLISSWGWF